MSGEWLGSSWKVLELEDGQEVGGCDKIQPEDFI